MQELSNTNSTHQKYYMKAESPSDQLGVDIYTIEKGPQTIQIGFKKPKFGLASIHNTCDNACLKWCMLYQQSEKKHNDYRIPVFKNDTR